MNNCGGLTSSGIGECNSRLKKAVALLISIKGTAYTAAQLATLTQTKTNIALAAGIKTLYVPLSGYTATTEKPKEETGSLGTTAIYDDAIPKGTAFMDRSFDDYKTLWGANNSIVDIEFITKDGSRLMTPTANGTYKGFRAEIYSEVGIPDADKPLEAHPIHIFFKDVEEFRAMEALPMAFGKNDVEDVVPVGLNLRAVGAYGAVAKKIEVKATKRGSAVGKAGLTTWVVLDSNVTTPTVTATDNGAGSYTLEITKATSDALVAGDFVTVQAHLLASTFATYLTNTLTVKP